MVEIAINELKRNIKVLFENRHNVGWGWKELGNIKEYNKCQMRRRIKLRGFILGVHILEGVKNAKN